MNKDEFIKKLKIALANLPEGEATDIISDYEEYFSTGKESGRSEGDIAKSLGDPSNIARQLKADYHVKKAANKASLEGILRAVFATAGLGVINLVFVFFPFMILVMMLFGVVSAGMASLASGIVGFIASLIAVFNVNEVHKYIYFSTNPYAGIFFSIAIIGFSALFLIACWYLIKWFYKLTIAYLKFNLSIIKGKDEK